ncbi:hypothetical protein QA633_07445 [Bradyrhizobium barranii]|uniref:hypothetical protein n=1 Tax=Bradyrhizobium barranii TaxID=2992140 RepID=UPI0024B121D6|nr:hypothetical protein [Bradyrhizobium barranii]WFT96903.1 hypothetical protein QA633_07445 [Bradyrhizobium barranii]
MLSAIQANIRLSIAPARLVYERQPAVGRIQTAHFFFDTPECSRFTEVLQLEVRREPLPG